MRRPGWFPAECADSAYHIDYEKLKERGIRGLIYDVDNTLVPHGAMPDNRAMALFARLHELGIPAVFVSNNREDRVKPFAEAVGAGYVYKAGKPRPDGYIKAMEMMGTDAGSTIFIGDQIFTDIWGQRLKNYSLRPDALAVEPAYGSADSTSTSSNTKSSSPASTSEVASFSSTTTTSESLPSLERSPPSITVQTLPFPSMGSFRVS